MATRDELKRELKAKRICRFCLVQDESQLISIYSKDARMSPVSLTVQIMAIASMEVFANDNMPSWVCKDCRMTFDYSYRFKQMCKQAETLLSQYPLTGQWPKPLAKPSIPRNMLAKAVARPQVNVVPVVDLMPSSQDSAQTQQQSPLQQQQHEQNQQQHQHQQVATKTVNVAVSTVPKKILNANPAATPEPPAPIRLKKEKLDDETSSFLTKVENNEELSIADVQRWLAANEETDTYATDAAPSPPPKANNKPKLLNKSSIRILNKEANLEVEPRLSFPKLKQDEDGNVAIVTEILDPSAPYESEPDPLKNAEPVETNVFPCPHCERSFPLLQLRDIHMVKHNRERSFQCNDCEKTFFSKYDLQKHSLIHTGERPFKCTVCEKAFTRATLLYRHEKTHTDIPKFICIYCEKPFISKEEMEKHTERHRKKRPFQCKLCNKSFAFKQGLERHEVVHSREQPYPCQYCEQGFPTPSKLARHLTAHAGSRPYPCKFCAKSFLLSHHLTRHMRSHKQSSGNFVCSECKKFYKTRDELIYHSAVHATQTLVCPLCKQSFENVDSVTDHIKKHAEGSSYACEFCDLIFIDNDELQSHIDSKHIDEMTAYFEDERANAIKIEEGKTFEDYLKLHNESTEESSKRKRKDMGLKSSKKVKILNNVVVPKPIPKLEDDFGLFEDDNILVANEAEFERNIGQRQKQDEDPELELEDEQVEEQVKEEKSLSHSTEPPSKVRKIETITKPSFDKPAATSIVTKLKAFGIEQSPKLKDEQSSTSSINKVLNALPKSVSVRRNATTLKPSSSSGSASTDVGIVKRLIGTLNAQENVKSSANGTATEKQEHGKKLVNMVIGDKKVKVQKITVTRAEANAMAKEGLLCMRNGAMILKQKAPKSNK